MLRTVCGDAVAQAVRSEFEKHLVVWIGMAAPCAAPACVIGHEFAVELRLRFANQPAGGLWDEDFLDVIDVIRQFGYSDMYVQFMGIPVDGTKSEMISKLRGKGFSYNRNTDELSGRFNGRNVILKVVENNGKV